MDRTTRLNKREHTPHQAVNLAAKSHREPKHLRFDVLVGGNTKLAQWRVMNRHDNLLLGHVAWFARWRKFAFYPAISCVFEEDCLRDISDFIVARTEAVKGK